jgi:uncharacterized damage-inducible protein DinB
VGPVIAPDVTRPDVPYVAGEREMLESWLDFHRATLLWKCAGLTDEQLKQRACPPSTLSLLGLVRHMNEVEQGWFGRFVGDWSSVYSTEEWPDADFDDLDKADPAADFAAFEQRCALSRERAAGRDLDETFTSRRGHTISLRWIYTHMIEEYARHNGHADLIREAIDGTTGD